MATPLMPFQLTTKDLALPASTVPTKSANKPTKLYNDRISC